MPDARVDLEKSRTLLKDKLLAMMPEEGDYPTPIKGAVLHRYDANSIPKPLVYNPIIIVIAQGKKCVRIGAEERFYGENSCFIAGVNMPAASCASMISPGRPFLSIALELDKVLLAQLAAEVPPAFEDGDKSLRGALIHDMDAPFMDAFLRLVELLEKPAELPVLAPMVVKEIHFRMLTGPFGPQLRSLNTFGSQGHQVTRAISWLLDNFKNPLHVDELADMVNMATSTFHKHFKEVTSLSPLQYQKRLRLGEAQRLMLSGRCDASQASQAVGYESVTQFNREYKRLFGEPPRRDVSRML